MALALLLPRPICCRPAAAATQAWLAARPRRLHTTTRSPYRQPAASTMGILFKQVSPAWLLAQHGWHPLACPARAAEASRTCPTRCHTHPTLSRLVAPYATQYLSGDKIYTCSQCKTHCTDHGQLISKVGATWSGSSAGMGPSGVLALHCQSPAGLVAAPAALCCPTRRPSKGGTAAPTCSAMCECGGIRCALVSPAPHRALAACPTLLRPYPPLL